MKPATSNLESPAEVNDLKLGMQFGFAKAHHKITPRKKWAWIWARGAPQNFGVRF